MSKAKLCAPRWVTLPRLSYEKLTLNPLDVLLRPDPQLCVTVTVFGPDPLPSCSRDTYRQFSNILSLFASIEGKVRKSDTGSTVTNGLPSILLCSCLFFRLDPLPPYTPLRLAELARLINKAKYVECKSQDHTQAGNHQSKMVLGSAPRICRLRTQS